MFNDNYVTRAIISSTDPNEVKVCEEEGLEEDLLIFDTEEAPCNNPLLLWLVQFLALLQQRHFLPDAALILLLRFLAILLKILSHLSPQLATFAQQFPSSLYKFHKLLGVK